jgi:sugar phosphate permease
MNENQDKAKKDLIFGLKMFIVALAFIIGIWTYNDHQNTIKEQNMSPLEKYYQTHPEQYQKDMKEQGQLNDLKKSIQDDLDKRNLK